MKKVLFVILLLLFVSCSSKDVETDQIQMATVLKDGVITISRPVPGISKIDQPSALSFMPIEYNNYWLKISNTESSLKLMKGQSAVKSVNFQKNEVTPGTYKVALKQSKPLWYAPDKYFTDRNLDIPSQHAEARYLKGALGKYALFLDKNMIIHTSETDQSGIKGLRLSNTEFEAIYNNLEPDSLVIVE